jgi:hypothetical protein
VWSRRGKGWIPRGPGKDTRVHPFFTRLAVFFWFLSSLPDENDESDMFPDKSLSRCRISLATISSSPNFFHRLGTYLFALQWALSRQMLSIWKILGVFERSPTGMPAPWLRYGAQNSGDVGSSLAGGNSTAHRSHPPTHAYTIHDSCLYLQWFVHVCTVLMNFGWIYMDLYGFIMDL